MDDVYYMKQAIIEAEKAFDKNEVPVGAVITSRERIIARAHNMTETLNDVSAHAEIQAITSASNFLGSKYLNDCTIYVTLEPCGMCAGALAWSQISRIVFGCYDQKKGFHIYKPSPLHPKTIVTSGVMDKECSTLLNEFFKQKRDLG